MRGDRARKSFRERGQDAPAVIASALWKRLRQQGGVSGLEATPGILASGQPFRCGC